MSATEFVFIGWCKEDNHDKIWGYFLRPTSTTKPAGSSIWWNPPTKDYGWNCVRFWGRRGKAMQFKPDITGEELRKVLNQKISKGYIKITEAQLNTIWPTFDEEMRMKLSFEVLVGNVK